MNDKSRPWYESQEMLDYELLIANKVATRWKCTTFKLPIKYNLDYAFIRDKEIVSFIEFKRVGYTIDEFKHFGGYGLSSHKWMAAKSLCQTSGKPFCLIIETKDNRFWFTEYTNFDNMRTVIGGRNDRGDIQDIEPWVKLNAYNFNEIML